MVPIFTIQAKKEKLGKTIIDTILWRRDNLHFSPPHLNFHSIFDSNLFYF